MRAAAFQTLVLWLLSSTSVYGAEDFSPLNSGLKMFWGLLVVLAILLVISFFVKRNFTSLGTAGSKGNINIIEIKHILPKKSLILVEVRGQEFLVGGGSDSIDSIVPVGRHEQPGFKEAMKEAEDQVTA